MNTRVNFVREQFYEKKYVIYLENCFNDYADNTAMLDWRKCILPIVFHNLLMICNFCRSIGRVIITFETHSNHNLFGL